MPLLHTFSMADGLLGQASAGALSAVILLSAAAVAVCMALRDRLPAGMPLGALVAVVSLSVHAVGEALARSGDVDPGALHLTAALAGLWYILAAGVRRLGGTRDGRMPGSALVLLAAAGACALLTCVVTMQRWYDPSTRLDAQIDFAAFALLTGAGAVAFRRPADAAVCFASLVAFAATLLAGSFETLDRNTPAGLALILGGAGALVAISPNAYEWRRRRRVWLTEPQRLADPPAAWPAADWAAVVLAVAAGVLAITEAEVPFALAPAGLAAMACGAVAHRHATPGLAGLLTLAFTVETAVLLCTAAISTGPFGVLAGFSLGAVWLAWLARFWEQQLLDDRAWTTAGRLIATARAVAGISAAVAFSIAWSDPLGRAPGTSQVAAGGGLALLSLAAAAFLSYRDVPRSQRGAELTACIALLAAARVAVALLFLFVGRESGELSILAIAATIIAFVHVWFGSGVSLPVSTALAAGLFPAMILFKLAQPFEAWRLLAPTAVALGAITVLCMSRPRVTHSAVDI